MGQAKNKMIEDQENGFTSGNDSFVCSKHFADYAIRGFIESHGGGGQCSYCKEDKENGTKERRVLSFDDLLALVVKGFGNEYGDPNNGIIRYDGETGQWDGRIYHTSDLVSEHIELVNEEDDQEILEDISNCIITDIWCQRHPYMPSENEELSFDWDFFCQFLKHRVRYVFYKHSEKIDKEYKQVSPSYILGEIGKFINGLELFYNTRKDGGLFDIIELYRARQHKRKEKISRACQIGTAPESKATANRFSAAGIPMFYGTSDKKTAVLETRNKKKKNEYISVGKFKNTRELNLIDLTRVPNISIFDLEKSEFYNTSFFLKHFIIKIAEPIIKDGREHFEYVPTQVVTEYLRHLFPAQFKKKVDGIRYKSSIDNSKICYVIFATADQCANDKDPSNDAILVLERKSILRFSVKKSIKNR